MTITKSIVDKVKPELKMNGQLDKIGTLDETLTIHNPGNFTPGEIRIKPGSIIKTYKMEYYPDFKGNFVSTERVKKERYQLVYLLGLVQNGEDTSLIFSLEAEPNYTLQYGGTAFPVVSLISLQQIDTIRTYGEQSIQHKVDTIIQTFNDRTIPGDME